MVPNAFAAIPLAVATLLFIAPLGAFAADAAAPAAAAKKETVRKFQMKTGMAEGKMVYLDAQGKANPVLKANVGETVEITIASGEGAEHDIVFPELNVHSKHFNGSTGPVMVRFKVTQPGKFTYFCSIPGHRQIGMEGVLEVSGDAHAAVVVPSQAVKLVAAAAAVPAKAPSIAPAAANAVSVALDPTLVPKAIGAREPQLLKYRIETIEVDGKLDDGTTFTFWTFGGKVPGPMLRVRKGDTVELELANARNSKAIHSIDLHSVTGGHGGGEHTQVAPGQSKTVLFKALNPGLYVYHCATASVPHHISAGMYGLILVEPPEGLAPVDREFYVMQGDLYTKHAAGTKGHHEYSPERASDELPTYVYLQRLGGRPDEGAQDDRQGG